MVKVSERAMFLGEVIGHKVTVDKKVYFIAPTKNELKIFAESNNHYEFLKNIKVTMEMILSTSTKNDFIKHVAENMRNWLEV